MSESPGYARPELLAEPSWLWGHRDDPTIRIVDCGGSLDAFERAHLPGAVRLLPNDDDASISGGTWLKDPANPLHVLGPDTMTALMGRLGISDDTTVVVYDDYNGTFATRLWWVLSYYGHAAVKVLNGGWQRWLAEGRPVTWRPTEPPAGRFTPRPNEAMRVRLDEMRELVARRDVQVVNVLWPEMYTGASNPFENRRPGHIPGSVNLPVERFFVDDEVPTFKPPEELSSAFAEAGLSPEHETIVHCQAGVRTTMGVFAATLLGWNRVRAYEASMAEWANQDDTPVERSP